MSSSLYVCAIDLARLRAIQAGGDVSLVSDLLGRYRDRIDAHDRYFSGLAVITRYTSLAEALQQIVRGEIDPQIEPRFQFEHATALLADALGEPLDASAFSECSRSLWDEVDVAIQHALAAGGGDALYWPSLVDLLRRGPFLDIPLDARWRLGSGYLTGEEVERAAATSRRCPLASTSGPLGARGLVWPDEALEGAQQYREWLHRAALAGVGLFLHC